MEYMCRVRLRWRGVKDLMLVMSINEAVDHLHEANDEC